MTSPYNPGVWRFTVIEADPTWTDAQAQDFGWLKESGAPSFQEVLANVHQLEFEFLAIEAGRIGLDNGVFLPASHWRGGHEPQGPLGQVSVITAASL